MSDPRPRHRKIFTLANLISVLAGIAVFFASSSAWSSYRGAIVAALAAGTVSAALWYGWTRLSRLGRVDAGIDEPQLGAIPPDTGAPSPTVTAPGSPVAAAYRSAASQLEAVTAGQVLLVSSPAPGQGASTVALNIAISATQAGRRVVLVDGDFSGDGLTRFGGTGSAPGLTDLANGSTDLTGASRIWALSPTAMIPFIPSGSTSTDEDTLRGGLLADAVDRITEHADLLLIDVPPLNWNGTAAALAAHADGSLLVVSENGDAGAVDDARRRLAEVGAPVVAHVVNRAGIDRTHPSSPWRRMIKRGLATALLSLLAFGGWNGYRVWDSWRSLERDSLDVAAAEALLPLPSGGIVAEEVPEETRTVVTSPPAAVEAYEEVFTSFLLIGSDEGGFRADVIILALLDGSEGPVMVSIPRDLYLPNRCTQGYTRINATYLGCGEDVNGPTLLALAVEDFTGIPVDHFALFDFDGFEDIIDEVGGVEICVEYPVRDRKSGLDLGAGCTNASGAAALAWVRSRSTQELREGTWRTMPGVSDLTRNERQQDVIIAMFSKIKTFQSPSDLAGVVRSASNAFTLDDQLGVTDAISLAWSLRDLDPDRVVRVGIPVQDFTTADGKRVLLPAAPFSEVIGDVIPELATRPV